MPNTPEEMDFRERVCLPMLSGAQNSDGGWGYRQGKESATEPTAWALFALHSSANSSEFSSAIQHGKDWLRAAQLPDRSWPAFSQFPEGRWLTSLACLALHQYGESPEAVAGGAKWLCNEWPGDSVLWRRVMQSLFAKRKVLRQNSALRGWSWTPGTSSWVEPTACALLLLRQLSISKTAPPEAEKRRGLAEAMLYDHVSRRRLEFGQFGSVRCGRGAAGWPDGVGVDCAAELSRAGRKSKGAQLAFVHTGAH